VPDPPGDRPAGHTAPVRRRRTLHRLDGRIAGLGFASGDRVVVGHWDRSPLGPFVDLMWATPQDERILFVAHERFGAFVTAVYSFDRVVVQPDLGAVWDGRTLGVWGGGRTVALTVGRGVPFPPRPLWVTRRVERPLGSWVTGSLTFGTSPTGVWEWYPARRVHRIVRAEATVDGVDLGALRPPLPAVGFGFSEPPRWPALTEVRPALHDPSGRLDARLTELIDPTAAPSAGA
jgi:hypothetical protein